MTQAEPPREQPTIRVSGLTVDRGAKRVLHDLSLSIHSGAVTGLLGPSGSGKTTLMRAIVGVQLVQAGTVEVLGLPAGDPALRTRLGYVTQAPSVYLDLSVLENLAYFARLLRIDQHAVHSTLDTVGLAELGGSLARNLSGGEIARLSLATALLNAPDVLVLDEPTVGLDPLLRRELWSVFRELAARGSTILVSSHVMDEADQCHQLVMIREGVVLADGTPNGLKRRTGTDDLGEAFTRLIEGEAGRR
jgi:ABC-2 type transport system ATP-binding protein